MGFQDGGWPDRGEGREGSVQVGGTDQTKRGRKMGRRVRRIIVDYPAALQYLVPQMVPYNTGISSLELSPNP